ncbi:OmpP1/FadL family transporter [Vibrio fluminensis]|uniref:OmpP1/FadL family transporter n=1 Tax=Vibrio fluminensis TaxID=2783614 RepID=UPI0018875A6A|nr:outer membrane protein transport protein [Vibrio fluminensis]
MTYKIKLLTLSSIMFATHSFAGGYMFPELGMMSISTAGAGAQAVAEGAETSFANPAAMTEFDSTQIAFNLQRMVSDIEYTDFGSTGAFSQGENTTQAGTAMPVASFYMVTPLNDKWSAGLAFASTGGSLIDYGDNFKGVLLLKDAQLLTAQLNPSVAYKVNQDLSIGVGLVAEYGMLEQNLAGSSQSGLPNVQADGDSFELGYTLSALYQLTEGHRIGFAYRSEISHDMEGNISVRSNKINSSVNIVMPATAFVSGYHTMNEKTALLWSLGWTDFSEIENTAISLTDRQGGINIARDWQDTFSASLGMHYQVTSDWRLESGLYYETSPQDDPQFQYPDVPTGEIWKLGMGASYNLSSQWRMQLYYEYYYGGTPEIEYSTDNLGTLHGEYDADIHFFGVLMNYSF